MKINEQKKPVAAVTGATGAIGKAIAQELASLNYQVVLITRDPEKSARAVEEIQNRTGNQNVIFKISDLSRHNSISDLASTWEGPLHLLINNAAVTPINREETPEGIEMQFATNVLGYFWMTELFTEILSSSSSARIVNVASYWAGGLDLDDLEFRKRPYHNHSAYRQSKQANRMLTPIFSKKLRDKNITVNACHPGDVNSKLSNSLGFGGSQSPSVGARTPVWVATSETLAGVSGKYYEHRTEVPCTFARLEKESLVLYEICQKYTA